MDVENLPEQNGEASWGFWATIGFSLLVLVTTVIVQTVVTIAFVFDKVRSGEQLDQIAKSMESNGFFLAVATLANMFISGSLILLLVKLRRGSTIKNYLALHRVEAKQWLFWLFATIIFMVCSDSLTYLLGRPIVPEYMQRAYRTAHILPLLWLAVIVAAPLFEEVWFRGFMFRGIARSKLGPGGAIAITAVLWAVIHLQYDLYGIATIVAGGIMIGIARWRTGSLYVPICMHMLWNLIATVEAAVL